MSNITKFTKSQDTNANYAPEPTRIKGTSRGTLDEITKEFHSSASTVTSKIRITEL